MFVDSFLLFAPSLTLSSNRVDPISHVQNAFFSNLTKRIRITSHHSILINQKRTFSTFHLIIILTSMIRFEICLAGSCCRVNTCARCILLVRSFNQPKLCSNASWNPNATTFANSSIVGTWSWAIFVDQNNTVVVARHDTGQILIWPNATVNSTTTILANLSSPWSLFVSSDDEIFVDNGPPNSRVDRWTRNGTRLSSPMSTCAPCSGLFVDSENNLYCSQFNAHQVVRTSLNNLDPTLTIVAGTGCSWIYLEHAQPSLGHLCDDQLGAVRGRSEQQPNSAVSIREDECNNGGQ